MLRVSVCSKNHLICERSSAEFILIDICASDHLVIKCPAAVDAALEQSCCLPLNFRPRCNALIAFLRGATLRRLCCHLLPDPHRFQSARNNQTPSAQFCDARFRIPRSAKTSGTQCSKWLARFATSDSPMFTRNVSWRRWTTSSSARSPGKCRIILQFSSTGQKLNGKCWVI